MEPILNLDEVIKLHVLNVYERHHHNHRQTAIALGIGRTTLYRYLKAWGIK